MFETAVFKPQAAAAHGRIRLLTVSVAFHSVAVVGIVVASVATVRFPQDAPRESSILNPIPVVSIPMPKGTPNATPVPVKPQPHPAQPVTRQATAPSTDVAPSIVPSTQPQVASSDSALTSTSGDIGSGPAGPRGVENGSDVGVDVGQTPVSAAPVPDVIYHAGADVKPAVVIQRVDPLYPRVAIASRMSGVVVIHCIIDKSGGIRDPQVMSSTFTPFNQPAVDAVRQWRFSPGTMRGQPVDTYFDLTVRFTMR